TQEVQEAQEIEVNFLRILCFLCSFLGLTRSQPSHELQRRCQAVRQGLLARPNEARVWRKCSSCFVGLPPSSQFHLQALRSEDRDGVKKSRRGRVRVRLRLSILHGSGY